VLAWSDQAPCEIHVAHVVEDAPAERSSDQTPMLAHWYQELERVAQEQVRRLPAPGDRIAPISYHLSVGRPVRDIAKVAKRLGVDLIVIGTRGRTGLTGMLMGSVARGVVRAAHCPVVCIQPGAEAKPAFAGRIVCPVDFSATSRRAMLTAAELAQRLDAELVLLHVRPKPLGATAREDAEARLACWRRNAEDCGAEVTTTCAERTSPAAEIVAYARNHDCDLIVMGTHGRTGLLHLLCGSVAEGVIRNAPCPVVTVHPEPVVDTVDGPRRARGLDEDASCRPLPATG
jgi:nucleotide-binding universal stress UspA family protein